MNSFAVAAEAIKMHSKNNLKLFCFSERFKIYFIVAMKYTCTKIKKFQFFTHIFVSYISR